MAAHKINVTVGDTSIEVNPGTLRMTSADAVHWAGTNPKKFSIVFENESLFGRRELEHAVATTHQRARAKGRFKYSVVSSENPSLTLDPEIIVGDPPTGPNP